MVPKTGPYTDAELLDYLKSILDPIYLQPLLELGEGSGLEVLTQMVAQMVRTSQAVDRMMEALFIKPWSGQSDEPAAGGGRASVDIDFLRGDALVGRELCLVPGVIIEEVTTDMADNAGVEVATGRRFITSDYLVFHPGDPGRKRNTTVAEREGYSFNNVFPNTLTSIVQIGAGLTNRRATVVTGTYVHRLEVFASPDVVVPEHVGQYIQFVSGSNAGAIRRVVGYGRANGVHGGVALLAKTAVLQVGAVVGTYALGEMVLVGAGLVGAQVLGHSGSSLILERVEGVILVGDTVTGLDGGATSTITAIDQDPALVAEVGTAEWRVMPWSDFGLTCWNRAAPTGGAAPVLDELGAERDIPRSPGEPDESYRARVANLPDNISPNAIRRICNRIFAKYGVGVCLREVGLELFRGILCEGDPTSIDAAHSYAYDMDHITVTGVVTGTFFEGELVTQTDPTTGAVATARICLTPPPTPTPTGICDVQGTFILGTDIIGSVSGASMTVIALTGGLRPQDRFKLNLDYTEFRAFFLLGLPPLELGDFGFAYDIGLGAYDLSGTAYMTFYDGWPVTTAQLYQAIWNAVDKAKAAGVGFDLYVERIGCF